MDDKKIHKINIKVLLVSIYTAVVCILNVFLGVTDEKKILIIFMLLFILFFYFLFRVLIYILFKVKLTQIDTVYIKKRFVLFLLVSLMCYLFCIVWFVAFYPGSFSKDSIGQYQQAITGEYSDWHPVLHTLICFTFPLKLTGKTSSIIVFQLIYFSVAIGYMFLTIAELWNIKAGVLSTLFILLNPFTCNIVLYPWKDVLFGICGLVCLVFVIRIIFGLEKNKVWKWMIFSIVLSCATVIRHNAIFFSGVLLIALLFNMNKTLWIKVCLVFVVTLILIKGPLYSILDVRKPGNRVSESMGLPLTIIANVAKETPEKMDDELSDFAYSIATQSQWDEYYQCGDFNSIKWQGIDLSVVEDEGYFGMIKLMCKCFSLSPKASLKAFVGLTDMVYGFESGLKGDVYASIEDNPYDIKYCGHRFELLRIFLNSYCKIINTSVMKYFRTHGIVLLVLLISFIFNIQFSSWKSWKKAFIVVPIFAYDFGTMFLLTGHDLRFFFITFLVAPILIVYLFRERQDNKCQKE